MRLSRCASGMVTSKIDWRVEPLLNSGECTAVRVCLCEAAMRKHHRNVARLCGNVIGFEKSHDVQRQLLSTLAIGSIAMAYCASRVKTGVLDEHSCRHAHHLTYCDAELAGFCG